MSIWIRNLKSRLADRIVTILHGNVRDRYIDEQGHVYSNLTALLTHIATHMDIHFHDLTFYDMLDKERTTVLIQRPPVPGALGPDSELDGTQPGAVSTQQASPDRVLAKWARQLSDTEQNHFAVIFYLDKLIPYKAVYQDDEMKILLRLEKLIENIRPNHRLVLVALQDTMVPMELYTHSPRTYVVSIPQPDKTDRLAYLKYRLTPQRPHLELMADLTDGLFLYDLDNVVATIGAESNPSERETRRLVNRYRIGEQEDHWGTLSISRLRGALNWFEQAGGIKGQREPLSKVVEMLVRARTGLTGMAGGTTSKPKGVLFFAGPTGVGKTFVAKKLAEFLFSSPEAFLRFDMSEFKEEHTVSKLIGSPPGYVGYERGGMLTNAVRERPFSVILFDEIEKAHPKIMDMFLQILDDGRLTDSRGQTVFFTETVIIFTSNLGTRTTDSRGQATNEHAQLDSIINSKDLDDDARQARIRGHFAHAVDHFFMCEISRPELLNRIGSNVVPFNCIQSAIVQSEIVRSHFERIKRDFDDKYRAHNHRLEFDEGVMHWLVAQRGQQMAWAGGRGITNAIDDAVIAPLTYCVLEAEERGTKNVAFRVQLDNGRIVIAEQ